MKSNLIDVACTFKHETKAAWLVNDGDRDIWLPKSQCEVDIAGDNTTCIVTLPEWLAIEKELI